MFFKIFVSISTKIGKHKNQESNNKVTQSYYFIMNKFTIGRYWQNQTDFNTKESSKEQQMGLFTFYKLQQEQSPSINTQSTNKNNQNNKATKIVQKINSAKANQSMQNAVLSFKDINKSHKTEKSQLFARRISIKKYQLNFWTEKTFEKTNRWLKKAQSKVKERKQQRNLNNPEIHQLKESKKIKSFSFVFQPQQGFISRPLKKLEEFMQTIKNDKEPLPKEGYREKNENNNQKSQTTIKSTYGKPQLEEKEQNVYRISTKKGREKKQMATTLQNEFLKEVRISQNKYSKLQKISKQIRISDQLQDRLAENNPYLHHSIDSFFLTRNQSIQAAKILGYLKCPNFLATNNSEPKNFPISIKTLQRENRVHSQNKECQFNSRNSDNEKDKLKSHLNQRFHFLFKKKSISNRFDNLRHRNREIYTKSQTRK